MDHMQIGAVGLPVDIPVPGTLDAPFLRGDPVVEEHPREIEEHPREIDLVPVGPECLEDLGLPYTSVEQIVMKTLYVRGETVGRDLAASLGLKFSLIDDMMETLKRQQVVQVRKSLGMGSMSSYFALTEAGRNLATKYLEINQYVGPLPVPMYQYTFFVRRQRQKPGWLTQDRLANAYKDMVWGPRLLSQIGPAVSSGNSFLIYGEPGNGKTFLAEALARLDETHVFMPYAVEHQGNIIQVYDPVYHQIESTGNTDSAIANDMPYDGRWFRCKRPFIVTGGELTLEMLDLSYNATSKIYDAPFQMKSNNGIYLVDDFGRQRATPAEILNRWIVPMERRVDYLSLRTGGKLTVPFECFLVFSTNLRPDQLGDEAFLRRIQYKMLLPNPDLDEFKKIFLKFCAAQKLQCPDGLVDVFIAKHYLPTGKAFRRCHPRDVLSHALDIIHFEKRPLLLTEELLDRGFDSCFAN